MCISLYVCIYVHIERERVCSVFAAAAEEARTMNSACMHNTYIHIIYAYIYIYIYITIYIYIYRERERLIDTTYV